MQILNSLGEFFNFSQNKEESKLDLKSDSNTKISFNDYLHDAMNDASHFESNKDVSLSTVSSLLKSPIETKDLKFQNENFSLGITLSSLIPKSDKVDIQENSTEQKITEESKNNPISPDIISDVVNVEESKQIIETEKLDEISTKESEIELVENENSEKEIFNSKENSLETNPLVSQNLELELETIENTNEETVRILTSLSDTVTETKNLENKNLNETKITELPNLFSTKEFLENSNFLEKKQFSTNSEKIEIKDITPKENKIFVDKHNSNLENKSFVKEEIISFMENIKRDPSVLLSKEVSIHENYKDKKESKKLEPTISVSKEIKADDKKTETKLTTSKEKQIISEFKEEVIQVDKSKWSIQNFTKKENTIEVKKENFASLIENSIKQNLELDKGSRLEISQNKIQTEIKPSEKTKEPNLLADSQNFQKSLNELVQKAKVNILENGKNTAQIALYPKELGKMTLNIEVVQDKVDGKILVESESIKNLLLTDLNNLKADLKSSGLDLASLSVEVKFDSSANSGFEDKIAKRENEFEKNKENSKFTDQEIETAPEINFSESKVKKLLDIKV